MDFNFIFSWLYDFKLTLSFFIQFLIFYVFILLIKSNNIYYSLLYLFIELLLFGVFISYYQMELFTGFLWIAEFTVLLILLILLIYLNSTGFIKMYSYFKIHYYYFIFIFIFSIIFSFFSINYGYTDSFLLDYIVIWDDFYESLNNDNMNDFSVLFLSYYNINSLEFIIFGFILFIGTLICIAVFKSLNLYKTISYNSFFSIFNLFDIKMQFNFLRQQNLHKQNSTKASNRVFKKK